MLLLICPPIINNIKAHLIRLILPIPPSSNHQGSSCRLHRCPASFPNDTGLRGGSSSFSSSSGSDTQYPRSKQDGQCGHLTFLHRHSHGGTSTMRCSRCLEAHSGGLAADIFLKPSLDNTHTYTLLLFLHVAALLVHSQHSETCLLETKHFSPLCLSTRHYRNPPVP